MLYKNKAELPDSRQPHYQKIKLFKINITNIKQNRQQNKLANLTLHISRFNNDFNGLPYVTDVYKKDFIGL